MSQGEIADEIYKAISNPIRRKMLTLIKERGTISFSELISKLQLEVGTFYYHLDALKPLVTQTTERHYQLSPLGYEVLDTMRQLEQQSRRQPQTHQSFYATINRWMQQIIAPSILFHYVAKNPRRFLFEAFIVAFINGWIVAVTGLQPFIFYVTSTTTPNLLLVLVTFIGGWLITFLVIEGLMRLLFRNKYGTEALLVLAAFIRLPVILYAGLWFFRGILFWIPPLGWLAVQLITEFWSMWFAVVATSNAKLARPEQAAVAVLILRFSVLIALGVFGLLVV